VLLKSAGNDTRGFVAKVSDFGLSMRIDPSETHVSNFYQGTLTHMVRGGGGGGCRVGYQRSRKKEGRGLSEHLGTHGEEEEVGLAYRLEHVAFY
jgi:hypothetical protein